MDKDMPKSSGSPTPKRSFQLAALALATVACLVVIACFKASEPETASGDGDSDTSLGKLFPKWGKPSLAIIVTGQQHGHLQRCGCSEPQFGGLTRRYNFIKMLKSNGWPVLSVDLGDIAQRPREQTMLKYTTSMEALKLMGYSAVGIGENEISLSLTDTLANYALENPLPRVLAANLRNKKENFPKMVHNWEIVEVKGSLKVGIIGVVGASVVKKVKDPDVTFEPVPTNLPRMVKEVRAKKPDCMILLYNGSVAEAKALAKAMPHFQVILCLSVEEEPPGVPEKVGSTSIINIGHKGRYVGVVGVYRTGNKDKPLTMSYQLISIDKQFDTPRVKRKDHPVMRLMEKYSQRVKDRGFLASAAKRQGVHPIQLQYPKSVYAGSQSCKKCHKEEYQTWAKSKHAHAYATLERAKYPSLRQYDAECIGCHVTGWQTKGGFTDETKTEKLRNVGCESCHGPGSEHIKFPQDAKLRGLMNPFRFDPEEKAEQRKRRLNLIDFACQKCHDIENDVHWKIDKWWKIVHSEDRAKATKNK